MPSSSRPLFLTLSALPMVLALVAPPSKGPAAKPSAGQMAFANRCAPCHGAKGEGGSGYAKPLTGGKTVAELARYVAASMPPGQGTPKAQAEAIAGWIYPAFYSPAAQARLHPQKTQLARLTVKQFRNAVADLVGDFAPAMAGPTGGLHGEYFKNRDINPQERVFERDDPGVNLDFGTEAPRKDGFEPHNFSIAWHGGLVAPDTGDYDLIVQSDQAVRVFFNGAPQPFIDGWVKSGKDTELRATTTLLGGRTYPIRLEFSKATQGVNDDDKKKGKPAGPAFVRLLWRRPRRVDEPIPARNLTPVQPSPVYVVANRFPADDRSMGFERGVDVDKEWDEAVTAAALDAANALQGRLDRNACRAFVARAFRRPLDKETERLYVDRPFETSANPQTAAKRTVLMTLLSPRFLYRELGPKDGYAVAANLSFGLWDTLPDPELERAAAAGELTSAAGVRKQADRLAADPRAWTKLRDFLLLWLKVDEVPDLVKSPKRFPLFDATAASDLRTSLELFLERDGWDYRRLMTDGDTFLNGRLAKVYGVNLPPDAPFQPMPSSRTGVLTQPYILARFAYLEGSSPIHRGVLIARNVLGRILNPPPAAFAPLAASVHPDFTTRQRVALQTKPTMCQGCHGMINPLGFTLEGYDAIGRARTTENGKPVDATGAYVSPNGRRVTFRGAADLAQFIAGSEEAHRAFVEKLFLNLVKQPPNAYGSQTIEDLRRSFEKDSYNVRNLMVDIMAKTAEKG